MHGSRVASTLSRRHFILTAATAAGGFMIGIGAAPGRASAATVTAQPWNDDNAYAANEIDAWIAIDPDDFILIRYQRSEMGQGSMTAVPMMIAEELQCDWSKVRIEYASPNRNLRENKVYGSMVSAGSRSVRGSQKLVQQVGASARERLIAAAAARWNVPASECSAAQSLVTHTASGRTLRYGELAADAAKITLTKEPAIKTPGEFTFIPRPMPRVDVVHKTDGSAKFGIDAQVPSMVFAAITACPVPGGKLKSVDDSVLSGAPGIVQVVKLDNAVAVVATDTFWRAKRALSRLQPEWDVGAAGSVNSEQLSKEYRAALNEPMLTARNDGNVDQAMSGAAKAFEAIYETPYLSHSPMEPMNATVHLQPDRLDVGSERRRPMRRLRRRPRPPASSRSRFMSTTPSSAAASGAAMRVTKSNKPSPLPRPSIGRSSWCGPARRIPARTSSVRMRWSPSRPPPEATVCRPHGRCASSPRRSTLPSAGCFRPIKSSRRRSTAWSTTATTYRTRASKR